MALRVSFLERALIGLSEVQSELSQLNQSLKQSSQIIAIEQLQEAQQLRGNALICLIVIKALTAEQTNAHKNRVAVIHESFMRSIYYLLLRGRPAKTGSS